MIHFFRTNLLWSEGVSLIIGLAIITIIALFTYPPLLGIVFGIFLFLLYFFRNPQRLCIPALHDQAVLVCPADGRIIDIQKLPQNESYAYRVSIFLSPFDVHVNRAPVEGTVICITHRPGRFLAAFKPESSDLNECVDLIIQTNHGTIKVRPIAGMLARRIKIWSKQGDSLKAGQPFGMIKFGSRVDLFLPASCMLTVRVGERVYGGETVIGRLTWH